VISFTIRLMQPPYGPRGQRGGTAMTTVWRNRMGIAMAAVIAAVAIAYALAPEPVASSTLLGPGWQCHRVAGIFTTCSHERRAEPWSLS